MPLLPSLTLRVMTGLLHLPGGKANDYAYAIAIDASHSAYVAGYTWSTNFPTVNPFQESSAGGFDAFVAKLNPAGNALVYSTYLGGDADDYASAIAIDTSGNAYVGGETLSTNFPTTLNPFQGSNAGDHDAFVVKVSSYVGTLYRLTVQNQGSGLGTVTGTGINCGVDCTENYPQGTMVTLTAQPNAGSAFAGWTDCDLAVNNTCSVVLNGDRMVTAEFYSEHGLVVSVEGTGDGRVTSIPPGIDCGVDCTENYPQGTMVTLTAQPNAGSAFAGWTDCDLVNGNACTVMMATNKSVNAALTLNQYTLTATKTGSGSGNLIASGLSCIGDTCTGTYDYNTTVNIEAVATTGSFFDGWTGCDSATYNVCTVLINADRNITASFRATYKGTVGTELTLADSDFGTKKGKVLIGGLKQKVGSWSDTSITVIVNKFKGLAVDTPYDVSIQWKPKGSKTTNIIDLPGAFTLKKPEINPISTDTGSPEDEITLNGMWFGTKKGKVYIGDQKCKVTSWTMDPTTGVNTLKFVIPNKIGAGTYGLEVENKIGRSVSFGFEVK